MDGTVAISEQDQAIEAEIGLAVPIEVRGQQGISYTREIRESDRGAEGPIAIARRQSQNCVVDGTAVVRFRRSVLGLWEEGTPFGGIDDILPAVPVEIADCKGVNSGPETAGKMERPVTIAQQNVH